MSGIVNLLNLDAGEKVSAIIPLQNFADGKYLLMATNLLEQFVLIKKVIIYPRLETPDIFLV